MHERAQQLEALLFVAGEPVAINELAEILGVTENDVISYANELYDALHTHGLSLLRTQSHMQLVTGESVAEFLSQYLTGKQKKLTKAASETLAVVAYRGPVTRYDVDALRGVDSRRVIRQLIHRGLVRQIRKAKETVQYDITEEFLQGAGVASREELPQFEALSHHEKVEQALEEERKRTS